MTQSLDIKEAERQAFRLANFEDGIMEIYLGAFFLLMSCYSLTRRALGPVVNIILVLVLIFLMAGLMLLAKKNFTLPRVGLVKFSHRTRKKLKTAHMITWGLVILTFIVLIFGSKRFFTEPNWQFLPQWMSDLDVDLFFALVTIAFFSLIAYWVGVPRFYVYGVLIGLGNFASTVLLVYHNVLFQWPVALAGLLIILTGGFILNRFISKYPIPEDINNG